MDKRKGIGRFLLSALGLVVVAWHMPTHPELAAAGLEMIDATGGYVPMALEAIPELPNQRLPVVGAGWREPVTGVLFGVSAGLILEKFMPSEWTSGSA